MKIPPVLKGKFGTVIDTDIFIYLFEAHPQFGELCEFIINQAENGVFSAVYTPITIAEILAKPISLGRTDLADKCRSVFRGLLNIKPVEIGHAAGELAGALKAKYALPLPNMIQAAAALLADYPVLITNDKTLKKISEITVLTVSDFN